MLYKEQLYVYMFYVLTGFTVLLAEESIESRFI